MNNIKHPMWIVLIGVAVILIAVVGLGIVTHISSAHDSMSYQVGHSQVGPAATHNAQIMGSHAADCGLAEQNWLIDYFANTNVASPPEWWDADTVIAGCLDYVLGK